MSSTGNTTNKPDAATLALWRAAEAGEFGEVEVELARVTDVNACNEHGVTALMRAAQRGHARVVRLLLVHGADANIVRNDKFTALSLAAFFGHTEVVRVLMEHGADSKASTRSGTSPHMWATARTFNEVVDQLKHPAPPKDEDRAVVEPRVSERPLPLPATPVAPRPVTAAIARTLKDPPEIWDLVHEAPQGFDASSAFMGRLQAMRRGMLFRLATVLVLICACVVGVLVLRGAQARSEAKAEQQPKDSTPVVQLQSETKAVENASVQPAATAPAAAPSSFVAPTVLPVATESFKTTRRARSHSSVVGARAVAEEPPQVAPTTESVQRVSTKSEVSVRTEPAPQTKSSSPLSPQLITPAKNAAPKTKVIQWP